jgi:hypothetical protein
MAALILALGGGMTSMEGCKTPEVVTPVTPEKKDTPEAKAAFMADVKETVLRDGAAKLTFEAIWVPTPDGKSGDYFLKPVPVINFTKVLELLKIDSQNQNIPLEKMGFEFFLAGTNGLQALTYAIPYSYIASKS